MSALLLMAGEMGGGHLLQILQAPVDRWKEGSISVTDADAMDHFSQCLISATGNSIPESFYKGSFKLEKGDLVFISSFQQEGGWVGNY